MTTTPSQPSSVERVFWIPFKRGRCPAIRHVEPASIQLSFRRRLSILVDHVPLLASSVGTLPDFHLFCRFKMATLALESAATLRRGDGNGDVERLRRRRIHDRLGEQALVECLSPRVDALPPLPSAYGQQPFSDKQSEAKLVATLAIGIRTDDVESSSGIELSSTNFTFFDCSAMRSCGQCVSSAFPCDWCVRKSECTYNAPDHCPQDALVNAQVKRDAYSFRIGSFGAEHCPRLDGLADGDDRTYRLVASGSSTALRVRALNLDELELGAMRCHYLLVRFCCYGFY